MGATKTDTPTEANHCLQDLPQGLKKYTEDGAKQSILQSLSKSKNPLHGIVKEELDRAEAWEKAFHGWTKQNSQSTLCAVSLGSSKRKATYLLSYAHRSRWSISHLRPHAITLCSALLWSFQTSWPLAVSALLQCLASNCCEAGLSSSSPGGFRSGLGV